MRIIKVKNTLNFRGHRGSIYGLTPGIDKEIFYTAGGDGWIVEWNLANPDNGKLVAKTDSQLFSMHCLAQQETFIAGNMNGGLHWINPKNPSVNKDILVHKKGVFGFLETNNQLFSIGGDGFLIKWDTNSRRPLESLQVSHAPLRSITYDALRQQVAIGSSDQGIYWVDVQNMTVNDSINEAHDNSVFALGFSRDGSQLFSGGRDAQLISRLAISPFTIQKKLPAHWFTINAIAVHPRLPLLATGSRDKTIKFWSIPDLDLLKVIQRPKDPGHSNSVNRLLWMHDGEILLSAGDDKLVKAWEMEVHE